MSGWSSVASSSRDNNDTLDNDNFDGTDLDEGYAAMLDSVSREMTPQPLMAIRQESNNDTFANSRPTTPTNNTKSERRISITQESAIETTFRLSNQFNPLIEEGADTLIYLGIPPKLRSQSQYEYSYVEQLFQRPYLLRSDTLRKLGPSKFSDFLGPVSARVERRLKKIGVHRYVQNAASIKYYIDLSPAIDGDEALTQVAQLTVPNGALMWHQKAKSFGISAEFVCGRDDLDIPPRPIFTLRNGVATSSEEEDKSRSKKINSTSKSPSSGQTDSNDGLSAAAELNLYNLPIEDEHSSLRHCTTTARLLHAIAGQNPKLNSAPKAWAFCMLANYYGCAQSPQVSTHVTSWLLQSGNINFIQVNPDVAYRMAIATQSIWLMRCTFAILVGQQAMVEAANDFYGASRSGSLMLKHAASCLDDDDINRIDHAASNLIRRAKSIFEELAVFPGVWNFHSEDNFEMAKLEGLRFEEEAPRKALQKVKEYFKHYVRRIIYMTMSDSYPADNKNVDAYVSSGEFPTFKTVPRQLRLLTQHFWDVLRKEEYNRDYLDNVSNHNIWQHTQETLQRAGLLEEPNIPYISKKQVLEAVQDLNDCLATGISEREASKVQGLSVTNAMALDNDEEKESDHSRTPDIGSPKKKIKLSPEAESAMSTRVTDNNTYEYELLTSGASTPTGPGKHTTTAMEEVGPTHSLIDDDDSDWEMPQTKAGDIQTASEDDDWEDAFGGFNVSSKSGRAFSPIHKMPEPGDNDIKEPAVSAIFDETIPSLLEHRTAETDVSNKPDGLNDISIKMYDAVFNSTAPNQPKSVPPSSTSLPFRTTSSQAQANFQSTSASSHRFTEKASLGETLAADQQMSDRILSTMFQNQTETSSGSSAFPSSTIPRPSPYKTIDESNNFTDHRYVSDDETIPVHKSPAGFKYPHESFPSVPKKVSFSQEPHQFILPKKDAATDSQESSGLAYFSPEVHNEGEKSFQASAYLPPPHEVHPLTPARLHVSPEPTPRTPSPEPDANMIAGWTLLGEISSHMHRRLHTVLQPGYLTDQTCDFDVPTSTIGTLLCLGEEEYKYLPLWAYGLDDGSGGVFNDGMEVPDAPDVSEGGFRGGAMGIKPGAGSSIGGSDAGDEFEDIGIDEGASTVGKASRHATDGTASDTVISLEEEQQL